MNNLNLRGLEIKVDFDGDLYVEVPDETTPTYTIVYLSVVPEPEHENSEEAYFRNHSSMG